MRPVITRSFSDVIEETPAEMLCSLLSGWYMLEAPHEIVVPFLPESHEILEEVLSERESAVRLQFRSQNGENGWRSCISPRKMPRRSIGRCNLR